MLADRLVSGDYPDTIAWDRSLNDSKQCDTIGICIYATDEFPKQGQHAER